jgi:hypothetical protein
MAENETTPEPPPGRAAGKTPTPLKSGRVRIGAVIALAAAAGLASWLLTRDDSSSSPDPGQPTVGQTLSGFPKGARIGPILLTATGVLDTARILKRPVYWVGPKEGYGYEFLKTAGDRVYVTYLPKGVKTSGNSGKYLIVATYPIDDALKILTDVAKKTNTKIVELEGGGIAVPGKVHPTSVFIAYPDIDYEIEVYAPDPKQARAEALSGKVRPV